MENCGSLATKMTKPGRPWSGGKIIFSEMEEEVSAEFGNYLFYFFNVQMYRRIFDFLCLKCDKTEI